jgi:hypothetical protein
MNEFAGLLKAVLIFAMILRAVLSHLPVITCISLAQMIILWFFILAAFASLISALANRPAGEKIYTGAKMGNYFNISNSGKGRECKTAGFNTGCRIFLTEF